MKGFPGKFCASSPALSMLKWRDTFPTRSCISSAKDRDRGWNKHPPYWKLFISTLIIRGNYMRCLMNTKLKLMFSTCWHLSRRQHSQMLVLPIKIPFSPASMKWNFSLPFWQSELRMNDDQAQLSCSSIFLHLMRTCYWYGWVEVNEVACLRDIIGGGTRCEGNYRQWVFNLQPNPKAARYREGGRPAVHVAMDQCHLKSHPSCFHNFLRLLQPE